MQADNSFRVVIPARYQSTRFPGKPLQLIAGKEMVLHVYEKSVRSAAIEVIIATDDQRIYDVAQSAGAAVCMTASDHETGTDRLLEVVQAHQWSENTIVVNVQGDEPLIPVECINQVAENLIAHPDAVMSTLAVQIESKDEYEDPNVVKVVFNTKGMAMYFSRSPIPNFRDGAFGVESNSYRHIGIYAYRAGYLASYQRLSSGFEQAEKLEQLRVLDNGDKIHVDVAREVPGPGVDTPEHLQLVESILAGHSNNSGHSNN